MRFRLPTPLVVVFASAIAIGSWGYCVSTWAAWTGHGIVNYYHNQLVLASLLFGVSAIVCASTVALGLAHRRARPEDPTTVFKFTIRDVLWLTVVVALVLGWWVSYQAAGTENRRIFHVSGELEGELQRMEYRILGNASEDDAARVIRLRDWANKRRAEREAPIRSLTK